MKIRNLYFIVAILLISSCERDDNMNSEIANYVLESFDGEWSLDNITCECDPIILKMGDDVWTFNSETNSLSIINNVSAVYPYLDSTGIRTISYTEDSIYFDGLGYLYYIEGESLFLADYPEADGPLLEFLPYEPLPNIDCCNLFDGLLQRNDSLLALEINSLCIDLTPNLTWTDPIGHFGNLNTLVNRLNADCANVNVSIACYACVETEPLLSELNFELDSAGVSVFRIVDISTPNDNVLSYTSIH